MGNFTSDSYQLDMNDEQSAPIQVLADKDFVMLYPSAAQDASLDQAILALYYLPPQFKLKVLTDTPLAQQFSFSDHDAVRSRIIIESSANAGLSTVSRVDALVYGENTPVKSESTMPCVVISDSTDRLLTANEHRFTISSNNPEALATAMLRIAHTAV